MVQENPAPGAIVGRTIGFLLGDQFARLKVGDRFFFDLQNQAGSFNLGTYLHILSLSLAQIIWSTRRLVKVLQRIQKKFY